MSDPVACRSDFIKKYKTQDAWKAPIEELIRKAPEFPGDLELSKRIGELVADLEFALRFPE